MFEAFSNVKVKDNLPGLLKDLETLKNLDILVGVPQEKSSRQDSINNAELVYIHTHGIRKREMINEMQSTVDTEGYSKAFQMYIAAHGSPLWQSPPRPIIEPAIDYEPNKKVLGEEMGKIAELALDGDISGAKRQTEITGITAENIVKGWWDNPANGWPPNAPSTIKAKGSDRPLIDTGELRKSITHVVREK